MSLMKKMARLIQQDIRMKRKASEKKRYNETSAFKKIDEEFYVVHNFDDIIIGWNMGECGLGYPSNCYDLNGFDSTELYTEEEMEKIYQDTVKASQDPEEIKRYEAVIKEANEYLNSIDHHSLNEERDNEYRRVWQEEQDERNRLMGSD